MANDRGNVALAVDGGLYIAPYGSAAVPTSSSWSPTSNGYDHFGYYSQDGAVLTPVPGTETSILAHNGDEVFNEQEPGWWTFAFGAIELRRPEVAEVYFDASIDAVEGSIEVTSAAASREYSMVAVAIQKDSTQQLYHYPHVKIPERQGVTFNRSTLEVAGLTFKTFKDQTLGYHFKPFDPKWIATPVAPTIAAAGPSAVAEGGIVKISGQHFADVTGAAGVKFGANNAAAYTVDSDSTIYAVMPSGSAGSAAIVVTNPTGASSAFPYTRGA